MPRGNRNREVEVDVKLKGHNVRRLLAQADMTIVEFAQALDVTPQHVSYMLAGTRRPSPEMRRRIRNQFPAVQWNDLFAEDR